MITRNYWCDDEQPCSEDGVCTRLDGHDGDHLDAATGRRWHNAGCQEYGRAETLRSPSTKVADHVRCSRSSR